MDEQRFDELSRKLATTVSRRQAVRIFGATAAGGFAAMFGARGASAHHNAQCRDTSDNCRSNAECCSGVCVDFHCACPPGQVLCPGSGECVQACFAPRVFNPATCQCECPTGTSTCGQFFCCLPTETCCSGGGFEQCCPPGFVCDQQQGCIVPQCQTAGQLCFQDNDCGQFCSCVPTGAGFGFCQ